MVHRPLLRKTAEVEEYKQEPSDPTESKPKLRKRKAGKNKSRTRKAWKPLDCDESPCSASTTTTTTATPETAFVPLGIEQCRGAAHRMWDIELPHGTPGITAGGAPGILCPLGGLARRAAPLMVAREITWEKMTFTVDSGASDTVIPPGCCTWAPLHYSSKVGNEYEVANGEIVHNLGEKRFIMKLGAKQGELEICCQVVESVQKPLLAVSAVAAQGHQVIFAAENSHILLSNGDKLPMRNQNGVYEIDIMVKSSGFTRQSEQ